MPFIREAISLLAVCAVFYGLITILFAIYCCRIFVKCARKGNDMEKNADDLDRSMEFESITETSVCIDESGNGTLTHQGNVNIFQDDNKLRRLTLSNLDQGNNLRFSQPEGKDMKRSKKVKNHEQTGSVRSCLYNDFSMDTRL